MHIWARGYFVSTVGINEAIIKEYIKEQQDEELKQQDLWKWKSDGD